LKVTALPIEPPSTDEEMPEPPAYSDSEFVAEAVAHRPGMDLLEELDMLLEEQHGPIPDEILAEAEMAWTDAE